MIIWRLLASVLLMAITAPLQQTITADAKTLRRSGNFEDRRDEGPVVADGRALPGYMMAGPPPVPPLTPLGIATGAPDLDRALGQNYFRQLYLRKPQSAVMTDETIGELAASDNYDPDQLARERAIRFRSNASNMSIQPGVSVTPVALQRQAVLDAP